MANLILWSSVYNNSAPVRTVACYQLASWLRQHGITVKVIDFCHLLTTDELCNITKKYIDNSTVAIGVSSTFWDQWHSQVPKTPTEPEWVLNARQQLSNEKVKWILGGAKSVNENFEHDWIKFHGFAEDTLLDWMRQEMNISNISPNFDITNATKSFLPDDYIQPSEVIPIELGRGCRFKCRFCSYPLIGKKPGTYTRDFSLIREEFIRNYNEYGTTKYYFQDDTVNDSEERMQMLADIVQGLDFELQWIGYNRLDLIGSHPNTIQTLKDSGLVSSYFGIESFHPTASQAIGKGWNGKHGKDFLLTLKEKWNNEINWHLSYIVGLPGENRDSIEDTLQWCIDNDMPDWNFIGLYINQSQQKVWKSEFDLNAKDYGYTFPYPNNPMHWKSDLWDAGEAFRYSLQLREKSYPYLKLSAWMMGEISSLGYSMKDLMRTKRIDTDWDALKRQTAEFARMYAKMHLT